MKYKRQLEASVRSEDSFKQNSASQDSRLTYLENKNKKRAKLEVINKIKDAKHEVSLG